ncbi:MAG: preprotein translocase subunit YajC [Helicobacteraceae bacterium]|jgi:preprotein translocase subunit YajC|nr:preprotein translocase subunit YajC [Helicobacteraceae bacterium]
MGGPTGGILQSILPFVVLFAIFYFLVIYPQQRQQKKHKEMIDALARGDKIITSGGIYAEVVRAEADHLKVKIADDVTVKLSKEFVAKKVEDIAKV